MKSLSRSKKGQDWIFGLFFLIIIIAGSFWLIGQHKDTTDRYNDDCIQCGNGNMVDRHIVNSKTVLLECENHNIIKEEQVLVNNSFNKWGDQINNTYIYVVDCFDKIFEDVNMNATISETGEN